MCEGCLEIQGREEKRREEHLNYDDEKYKALKKTKDPSSLKAFVSVRKTYLHLVQHLAHAECCTPANQLLTPHPTHPTQPSNSANQLSSPAAEDDGEIQDRRQCEATTAMDVQRRRLREWEAPVRVAVVAARPASPSPCHRRRHCTSVAVVASHGHRRRLLLLGCWVGWSAELIV
ncbi:hypothetical protein LWI29_000161 [Acer saccharum]|uniref:Uncharacterized protein n=1 Tax=Acer saccharum TaxID=4024 RepID=A0AA39V817_ACESA|nr:hypothetical protein LWI29_000161 [Acer saccharum]